MEFKIFLLLITLSCIFFIMEEPSFVPLVFFYWIVFCGALFIFRDNPWTSFFALVILLVAAAVFSVDAQKNKLITLGGASWLLSCLLFVMSGEKIVGQALSLLK